MANINLGNAQFELKVNGADEAIEKLNQLEGKLIEVKSLIREITSMGIAINFFESEKLVDDSLDN